MKSQIALEIAELTRKLCLRTHLRGIKEDRERMEEIRAEMTADGAVEGDWGLLAEAEKQIEGLRESIEVCRQKAWELEEDNV